MPVICPTTEFTAGFLFYGQVVIYLFNKESTLKHPGLELEALEIETQACANQRRPIHIVSE